MIPSGNPQLHGSRNPFPFRVICTVCKCLKTFALAEPVHLNMRKTSPPQAQIHLRSKKTHQI